MVKEKKEKEFSESKRLEKLRNESFTRVRRLSKEIKYTKEKFKKEGRSQEDLNKTLNTLKEKRKERIGERVSGITSHIGLVGSRIEKVGERIIKGKILSKPKEKLFVPISNKKILKSFTQSNYTMFKSEPKNYSSQPVQDKRNLFFN